MAGGRQGPRGSAPRRGLLPLPWVTTSAVGLGVLACCLLSAFRSTSAVKATGYASAAFVPAARAPWLTHPRRLGAGSHLAAVGKGKGAAKGAESKGPGLGALFQKKETQSTTGAKGAKGGAKKQVRAGEGLVRLLSGAAGANIAVLVGEGQSGKGLNGKARHTTIPVSIAAEGSDRKSTHAPVRMAWSRLTCKSGRSGMWLRRTLFRCGTFWRGWALPAPSASHSFRSGSSRGGNDCTSTSWMTWWVPFRSLVSSREQRRHRSRPFLVSLCRWRPVRTGRRCCGCSRRTPVGWGPSRRAACSTST
jgi:hypothetical protein